jgi:hypothetical protein
MKHAREDYERIQDPALTDPSLLHPGCAPIGEDEPVFLLRAKDVLAADVVDEWASGYEQAGGNPRTVERVRQHASRMRKWGEENGTKLPDTPQDEEEST